MELRKSYPGHVIPIVGDGSRVVSTITPLLIAFNSQCQACRNFANHLNKIFYIYIYIYTRTKKRRAQKPVHWITFTNGGAVSKTGLPKTGRWMPQKSLEMKLPRVQRALMAGFKWWRESCRGTQRCVEEQPAAVRRPLTPAGSIPRHAWLYVRIGDLPKIRRRHRRCGGAGSSFMVILFQMGWFFCWISNGIGSVKLLSQNADFCSFRRFTHCLDTVSILYRCQHWRGP